MNMTYVRQIQKTEVRLQSVGCAKIHFKIKVKINRCHCFRMKDPGRGCEGAALSVYMRGHLIFRVEASRRRRDETR